MFPIFPGVTLLGMAELGARQQKMDEMKLKDAQLQNQLLQAQVPAQLKALRDAQTQQRIGAEMQAGRLPQTLGLPSAQPMPQAPGAPMGAAPPPQPQIPGAQPVPGMAPQGAPAPAPGTPSMPMAAPPAPYASRGPQAQPQGGQPQGPTPGAPVPFHTNPEAPAIPATTQDAMGLIMQHRTIAEAIHSNPMLDAAFKNQVEGLRDWYNAHPNATVEELSAAMTNYDEKTAGLLQQESQARGHDTEAAASLVGAGLRLQSARETANIHAEATRDAARIHAQAIRDAASTRGARGPSAGNYNQFATRQERELKPITDAERQSLEIRGLISSGDPAALPQLQKLLTQYMQGARITNQQYAANANFGNWAQRMGNIVSRFASGKYSDEDKKQITKMLSFMDKEVFGTARKKLVTKFKKEAEMMNIDPAFADYPSAYDDSGGTAPADAVGIEIPPDISAITDRVLNGGPK